MNRPVITKALADKLALGANGSYSNEGNALQHTLFDTAIMPAALGANVNYFVQPIGAAYGAGAKTITETNLTLPGQLPVGQTFVGTSFSVAMKANADTAAGGGNALADDVMSGWYGYMQNSTFRIIIAGRDFEYEVPGSELIPTAALNVVGSANALRTGDFWTSGWTKLNITPIILGSQVSFSVVQIQGQQTAAALAQVNNAMAAAVVQNVEVQVRIRGILTRSI